MLLRIKPLFLVDGGGKECESLSNGYRVAGLYHFLATKSFHLYV